MAQRRMTSLKIVDTDSFLDMPKDSRLLYYDFIIRADDDGFVSNPKKIMRMIGASDDDLKLLIHKNFVIPFESGVCVIRHWRIHNLIRSDRYTETEYKLEKSMLKMIDNKYLLKDDIPNDNQMEPQVRLGKVRLGKDRKERETPSQKMIKFINSDLKEYSDKFNCPISELEKFRSYWTEPNKSGTKTRWQLEKTFDLDRRVRTWLDRANQYSKEKRSEKTGKYSGL